MSRTGNRGFTLIELMVATAVISLLSVLIYGAFFRSLDAYSYCFGYIHLAPWMDEKIWHTQDELRRLGLSAEIEKNGAMRIGNKTFRWELSYGAIDMDNLGRILYEIDLAASPAEGSRTVRFSRSAYALYEEKE